MEKNEHSIKSYLQRISDVLLINGGFSGNSGLYTGEMGIVLFFFHYSRLTQNRIFADYGSGLMKKILNKINRNTPVSYKYGMTGIGSAIEYLVQKGLLEANTGELLEDFDKRLFFTYNLISLSTGEIVDIGYYALWRMSGNRFLKETITETVLQPIVRNLENWRSGSSETHFMIPLIKEIVSTNNIFSLRDRPYILNRIQSYRTNTQDNIEFSIKNGLDLGYQNGLAGLGLAMIFELGGDDSWLSLFPDGLI